MNFKICLQLVIITSLGLGIVACGGDAEKSPILSRGGDGDANLLNSKIVSPNEITTTCGDEDSKNSKKILSLQKLVRNMNSEQASQTTAVRYIKSLNLSEPDSFISGNPKNLNDAFLMQAYVFDSELNHVYGSLKKVSSGLFGNVQKQSCGEITFTFPLDDSEGETLIRRRARFGAPQSIGVASSMLQSIRNLPGAPQMKESEPELQQQDSSRLRAAVAAESSEPQEQCQSPDSADNDSQLPPPETGESSEDVSTCDSTEQDSGDFIEEIEGDRLKVTFKIVLNESSSNRLALIGPEGERVFIRVVDDQNIDISYSNFVEVNNCSSNKEFGLQSVTRINFGQNLEDPVPLNVEIFDAMEAMVSNKTLLTTSLSEKSQDGRTDDRQKQIKGAQLDYYLKSLNTFKLGLGTTEFEFSGPKCE